MILLKVSLAFLEKMGTIFASLKSPGKMKSCKDLFKLSNKSFVGFHMARPNKGR